MANLISIPKEETGNLLSYKSLLKDSPSISFLAGGATSSYSLTDELQINKNALSFKGVFVQDVTYGNNAQFNFGDALEFTASRNGTHTFSFFVAMMSETFAISKRSLNFSMPFIPFLCVFFIISLLTIFY